MKSTSDTKKWITLTTTWWAPALLCPSQKPHILVPTHMFWDLGAVHVLWVSDLWTLLTVSWMWENMYVSSELHCRDVCFRARSFITANWWRHVKTTWTKTSRISWVFQVVNPCYPSSIPRSCEMVPEIYTNLSETTAWYLSRCYIYRGAVCCTRPFWCRDSRLSFLHVSCAAYIQLAQASERYGCDVLIFVSRALSRRVLLDSLNCDSDLDLWSMATNEQLALDDLWKVHRLIEMQGPLMASDAVTQLVAVWGRKINGLKGHKSLWNSWSPGLAMRSKRKLWWLLSTVVLKSTYFVTKSMESFQTSPTSAHFWARRM